MLGVCSRTSCWLHAVGVFRVFTVEQPNRCAWHTRGIRVGLFLVNHVLTTLPPSLDVPRFLAGTVQAASEAMSSTSGAAGS